MRIDLSDAIRTLAHLYLGGVDLRCYDAADANDDGKLDLSDPIMTLHALFLDTSIKFPPPNIRRINPYGPDTIGNLSFDSAMGIDTTRDNFPWCQSGIDWIPGVGLKTD